MIRIHMQQMRIMSRYHVRFLTNSISIFCLGRIVNVTSVKGLCAYPCFGAYNISKYGAEGLTDTLRLEMKRFGVKVIAVEPGNFGGATALWDESNVRTNIFSGT